MEVVSVQVLATHPERKKNRQRGALRAVDFTTRVLGLQCRRRLQQHIGRITKKPSRKKGLGS